MFIFDENKIKEQSMVDVGYEILKQSKSNYPFNELIKEIGKAKGLSEEEIMDNIAQLFTEINIDGRFIHVGQNEWGLKSWYPVDQTDSFHLLRDDEDEDDEFDSDYDEDYIDDDDEEADEVEEDDYDEDLAKDEEDEAEEFDEEDDFVEDIDEEDDFIEDIDGDIDAIDIEDDELEEDIDLDLIDEED